MKRFMTYAKNRKGITIVMIALMLFLLLALLGMAVDIAQVYFAKTELQAAADAAALAGAGGLDGTSSFGQKTNVRDVAWQVACKNSASRPSASSPQGNTKNVFLAKNGPTDCSTIPDSLNNGNDPSGDIVLGSWNPDPTANPRFTPNSTPVNAVRVVASRTSEPYVEGVKNGDNPVLVFIGRVFRFIGLDWSFLNVKAEAIAWKPPAASQFISVGSTFCPPVGDAQCVGSTGSAYPTICQLTSPRILSTQTSEPEERQMAWTTLLVPPGDMGSSFRDRICSNSISQDVCPPQEGIWGIDGTGTTFKEYRDIMYNPNFDALNKIIDPLTGKLTWWIMIPRETYPTPMAGPEDDAHPVLGYVLIRIIAVCASAGGGGGGVGCDAMSSSNDSDYCSPGGGQNIVIDHISCIDCGSYPFGLRAKLVK